MFMNTVAFNHRSSLPHPSTRLVPVAKPPCFYDENLWDVDVSTFADVRHAGNLCRSKCPRFAACVRETDALIADGRPPRSQVVAGRTFNHRGVLLASELDVLKYMNTVAKAQELHGGDPLVSVKDSETGIDAETVSREQEILRALEREVETDAGVQFTLDLGA